MNLLANAAATGLDAWLCTAPLLLTMWVVGFPLAGRHPRPAQRALGTAFATIAICVVVALAWDARFADTTRSTALDVVRLAVIAGLAAAAFSRIAMRPTADDQPSLRLPVVAIGVGLASAYVALLEVMAHQADGGSAAIVPWPVLRLYEASWRWWRVDAVDAIRNALG